MEIQQKCFDGDKQVPCPGEVETIPNTSKDDLGWERRILPSGLMSNERNDALFLSVLFGVVAVVIAFIVFKVKIFGRTLGEYIRPIWPYMVGAVLVVISQYLIVLPYNDMFPFLASLSQVLWAVLVSLSVMKLCKDREFNFGNVVFLGLIYSVLIHGLKVTIRYFFYDKTIFYVADRFVYGSLLVMLIVVVFGPALIYLRHKGQY
ncbi:MAG: hypothetical protein U9Q67_00805 [Patescibacteria group bacterium]|nr:hypothetical protein [Patescibacteria group bacterium]